MVSDSSVPCWVKPMYVISGIENKNPEKPNRYHERILGKRCAVERLEYLSRCWLWIEGMREWESWTHFHTSTVGEIRGEPGVLVFETTNSVYRLTRLNLEDQNENV